MKKVLLITAMVYGWVFMALITTLVLCARCQDSVLSVTVRRADALLSIALFKGGGKPRPKTRETATL